MCWSGPRSTKLLCGVLVNPTSHCNSNCSRRTDDSGSDNLPETKPNYWKLQNKIQEYVQKQNLAPQQKRMTGIENPISLIDVRLPRTKDASASIYMLLHHHPQKMALGLLPPSWKCCEHT